MGAAWRITLWRPVLCVPNGGARKAGYAGIVGREMCGDRRATPRNHVAQEGASRGQGYTFPIGGTSVGTYKLEEALEKPCCDLLAAYLRKCACAWPAWHKGDFSPPGNWGRNHNSWGNVYNLCRVKTVMTAVLTVKSGMDPHTISWEGYGWAITVGSEEVKNSICMKQATDEALYLQTK
ncbi:hypothetical protein EJB05_44697, partial [Eragrostis curvula]